MKRHNHETDIKVYREICSHYFMLVSAIIERTDLDLEDVKQEKEIFRPKYQELLGQKFLGLYEDAGIEDQKININEDGFSCSFWLSQITYFKRMYERKLVTPKHHLYFVKERGRRGHTKAA